MDYDDNYDYDSDDDELDELDDIDSYEDDDIEEESECDEYDRILAAEDKGRMDGEFDARYRQVRYTGFGASTGDENEFSDEEREAYESGYENGFDMGEM